MDRRGVYLYTYSTRMLTGPDAGRRAPGRAPGGPRWRRPRRKTRIDVPRRGRGPTSPFGFLKEPSRTKVVAINVPHPPPYEEDLKIYEEDLKLDRLSGEELKFL